LITRKIIGFDRRIHLEWVEATAEWKAQGLTIKTIRTNLYNLLEGHVSSKVQDGAIRKTFTVLSHIWLTVSDDLVPLRDDGLFLLLKVRRSERIALHWGMCMATYPFFSEVAGQVGRLNRLQGKFTLHQVRRRTIEKWGDTERVRRSVRHVVQSLRDWKVLIPLERKGAYSKNNPITIESKLLKSWLVEALVRSNKANIIPVRSVKNNPIFFPFTMDQPTVRDLDANTRLSTFRHGLDEDMVTLNYKPSSN